MEKCPPQGNGNRGGDERGRPRNELSDARPSLLLFNTGVLTVESDAISGGRANVLFHKKNLYIDKVKVRRHERPLKQLLKRRLGEPMGCVVREAPRGKMVRSIEIHLEADIVWVGERPFLTGGSGPKAPKTKIVYTGKIMQCSESHAVMKKIDESLVRIEAEQCFLFGVCLDGFPLSEFLSRRREVEYEMSRGHKSVKCVAIEGSYGENNVHNLTAWCSARNVPPATTQILVMRWHQNDLAPVIDKWDLKEVVEVAVSRVHV